MKNILVALMFFTSQVTFASELDNEHAIVERSHLGQSLPGSVVVRESLKDGSVEVLHVNQKLPADKSAASKLATAPFQPINVDTQLAGAAGNETDSLSSTSSWVWALALGLGAFALGRATTAYASPYYGGGYYGGGVAPPAYYGAPPPPPAYYGRPAYAPTYAYGGQNFAFRPYYGYSFRGYRYGYYANPYANIGYNAQNFWDWQATQGY